MQTQLTRSDPDTLRVLVVDDEPAARQVCARALRQDGHHVYEAPDAFTALRLAGRARFDVALVDLHMPDADGDALMRHLRASDPDLGLVAMTGRPDAAAHDRFFDAGADAFLGKPYAGLDMVVMTVRAVAGLLPRIPDR